MKQLLPKLTERLRKWHRTASQIPVEPFCLKVRNEPVPQDGQTIIHAYFWRRMGQFFKPGDIIVTETGMQK